MDKNKKLKQFFAVGTALLLWQIISLLLQNPILLASPLAVIQRLCELCKETVFWKSIGFSFVRIAAGFLLGMFAGSVFAVLAGKFSWLETLLWPYMITIKSVPVVSFIILCLVWMNAKWLSALISFLMVLPIIYTNVLQGMKSTDEKLKEMAELFRIPWHRQFFLIYLPQIKSFLLSASSVSIGLAWKAGLAAEIIGIPDGSMGERLYEAKLYLATADLLAWTVVIVLISVLFEKIFLKMLKNGFKQLERI